jgi:hypothetical protein
MNMINAIHEPKSWIRFLSVAGCLALLAASGCASYFPMGEMSYQELKQRNQEKQQESQLLFKPGTVFYSQ